MKYVVNVEVGKYIKEYKKNFKKCIGTGRVDLALREDYMNNLRNVRLCDK